MLPINFPIHQLVLLIFFRVCSTQPVRCETFTGKFTTQCTSEPRTEWFPPIPGFQTTRRTTTSVTNWIISYKRRLLAAFVRLCCRRSILWKKKKMTVRHDVWRQKQQLVKSRCVLNSLLIVDNEGFRFIKVDLM